MKAKANCMFALLSMLGSMSGATSALAADEKVISSAICQAMTPLGSQHLQHNGSSVQAVGVDVTVVCPIVRDNLDGRLQWVDVRHLRPDDGAGQKVSGKVFSCNAASGGCSEKAAESSASNVFTSVHVDTHTMPKGKDQYFYYRMVLPKDWKIVSIKYRED
jgi:hypothetical protein